MRANVIGVGTVAHSTVAEIVVVPEIETVIDDLAGVLLELRSGDIVSPKEFAARHKESLLDAFDLAQDVGLVKLDLAPLLRLFLSDTDARSDVDISSGAQGAVMPGQKGLA
ncbi:hypothetical protein [Streptomyces marincola]|uniref:hypothetical protein n=1 Tax=Streptomyces marincola TaxID=2878388 RepID=UPI001CF55771|nr:hypothetical protein [Streptomyces marincola]UCM91268.1 hypothetical protein LC193_26825 [Streptomyces marincola]